MLHLVSVLSFHSNASFRLILSLFHSFCRSSSSFSFLHPPFLAPCFLPPVQLPLTVPQAPSPALLVGCSAPLHCLWCPSCFPTQPLIFSLGLPWTLSPSSSGHLNCQSFLSTTPSLHLIGPFGNAAGAGLSSPILHSLLYPLGPFVRLVASLFFYLLLQLQGPASLPPPASAPTLSRSSIVNQFCPTHPIIHLED